MVPIEPPINTMPATLQLANTSLTLAKLLA
jgi:hypothetical protein